MYGILGDTVNKRAVRILLECFLVIVVNSSIIGVLSIVNRLFDLLVKNIPMTLVSEKLKIPQNVT